MPYIIFFSMIHRNYMTDEEVFLGIKHIHGSNEIQITRGTFDSDKFSKDHTILIPATNPVVLWNVLYDLAKLPYPKIETPKLSFSSREINSTSPSENIPLASDSISHQEKFDLEDQLKKLTAKEIVDKVLTDTGHKITNCLKSKSTILSKALLIYQQKSY